MPWSGPRCRLPTVRPACCSLKFSVPFLIGRPEGPEQCSGHSPPVRCGRGKHQDQESFNFQHGVVQETAAAPHQLHPASDHFAVSVTPVSLDPRACIPERGDLLMFTQPHQFAGLHQRVRFVLRVMVVAPARALMRDAAVGERSGVVLIEDADLWAACGRVW